MTTDVFVFGKKLKIKRGHRNTTGGTALTEGQKTHQQARLSPFLRLRSGAAGFILVAGLGIVFSVPLAHNAAGQTPPPDTSADNREDLSPQSDKGESDNAEKRQRYYLGPAPDNDQTAAEPWMQRPADQAPTSILIGPYVPDKSIALPTPDGTAPAEFTGDDTAATDDDITATSSALKEDPLDNDIAIDRLDRLDPAAIGIWTDTDTAPFPVNLWNGSQRTILETLIPALPSTLSSSTVKSLFRRLLLSPASVPDASSVSNLSDIPPETDIASGVSGAPDTAGSAQDITDIASPPANDTADLTSEEQDAQAGYGNTDPVPDSAMKTPSHALLLARLERLYTAGLLQDFLALADHLPADIADEPLAHMHANARLVQGDYDTACTLARTSVSQSGAAHWLRMIAMCEALNGRRGATYLQLALLDDAGEGNIAFNSLVEHLLSEIEGQTAEPASAPDFRAADRLSPTLFALFRLTGLGIPPDLALTATPILMTPLAKSPDLDPETRLILAEKSARAGLLDGETLAGLFTRFTFSDAERQAVFASLEADNNQSAGIAETGAATDAEPGTVTNTGTLDAGGTSALVIGPRLNALLWQQAAMADSATDRIRWIEIALEHSRKKGLTTVMARALRDPLMAVNASMSLGGYADSAGRIHLLNGDTAAALAWYEAARLAAEAGNSDARRALTVLWPLLAIADETGAVPYDASHLADWWQARLSVAPDSALLAGDRFFTRLTDLGMPVPISLTNAVLAAPHTASATPPAILWRQLLDAIRSDRLGETVLTGLVALSDHRLDQTDPALLSAVIAGLRMTGLEKDARRLAFEAMIADGF